MNNKIINKKITIELYDIPPPEIRGNSRAHYKIMRNINRQRRETAKYLALDAMQEKGIKTLKPRILVHYHFYNTREIDLDNLIIGMKCTLDGIVDSGLKLENEKKTLITLVEI